MKQLCVVTIGVVAFLMIAGSKPQSVYSAPGPTPEATQGQKLNGFAGPSIPAKTFGGSLDIISTSSPVEVDNISVLGFTGAGPNSGVNLAQSDPNSGCAGYFNKTPVYSFNLLHPSNLIQVSFATASGSEAALVVRMPDQQYYCSGAVAANPTVTIIGNTTSSTVTIWLGTRPTSSASGSLIISNGQSGNTSSGGATPAPTLAATLNPNPISPSRLAVLGTNGSITIMDPDGKNPQVLNLNGLHVVDFDWLIQGSYSRFALMVDKGQADYQICTYDSVHISDPRCIVDPINNAQGKSSDLVPVWSPNGNLILFASGRGDSKQRLYTMAPDGSNIKLVTPQDQVAFNPAWSPDGKQIAFADDATKEVFVENADGSNLHRLTTNGMAEGRISWSPDGTILLYSTKLSPTRHGLREVGYLGGRSINIVPFGPSDTTSNIINGRWSPDGKQIVFAATQAGESSVYIMKANGSGLMRVAPGTAAVWRTIPVIVRPTLSPTQSNGVVNLVSSAKKLNGFARAHGTAGAVGGPNTVPFNPDPFSVSGIVVQSPASGSSIDLSQTDPDSGCVGVFSPTPTYSFNLEVPVPSLFILFSSHVQSSIVVRMPDQQFYCSGAFSARPEVKINGNTTSSTVTIWVATQGVSSSLVTGSFLIGQGQQ